MFRELADLNIYTKITELSENHKNQKFQKFIGSQKLVKQLII